MKAICLWSGPRNVSTALMYSFAQRSDTRVVDEPLYGHFLRVSGTHHPGRDEVLASWRRIIDGPSPPDIRCSNAVASVTGDTAFVICTEHLPDGDLVATNVFALEHGRWRLVHHQAGPAPQIRRTV